MFFSLNIDFFHFLTYTSLIQTYLFWLLGMYILIQKDEETVLGHKVWCGFGYNASIESSFNDLRVLSFEKNQKSIPLIAYSTAEFALHEASRLSKIIKEAKGKDISFDIMPLYVYLNEIANWGVENCFVPTVPHVLIVKNERACFGYNIWCGFGGRRVIADSFEDIRVTSSEKNQKTVCLEIFSTAEYAAHEAERFADIIKKEHEKDISFEIMPFYVLLRQFESFK